MSKRKTQAGRETWKLICWVVAPALPPVTTKTAIKAAAYIALKVGKDFPQSIVDEAAQERNGWPTKARVEARIRELGYALPVSPWLANTRPRATSERLTRGTDESGDILDRLRWELRNAHGATAEVLERILAEHEGRAPRP